MPRALVAARPPLDDEFFARYFDYAAEDRYGLRSPGRPGQGAAPRSLSLPLPDLGAQAVRPHHRVPRLAPERLREFRQIG